MTKQSWFSNWFDDPYYHILYQHRDFTEAAVFTEKLLRHLAPPKDSRMLDIACGSGRFAIQLANAGYEVTGIDLSLNNIEKAKASERAQLRFFVHDMRMPFYINYFDYAFNFFTSFGYFSRQRDHMMAAKSFAGALKPGGKLVIDYLNVSHTSRQLIPAEKILKGSYTFDIKRRMENGYFLKDIRFTDAAGNPRHYTERVAAFAQADFEKLFSRAGMRLTETFGDYNLGAFEAGTSPRLIMIFEK